jgi:hypothetical protein
VRRIIRRTLVRDPDGRPLSIQSERVTDDGTGGLQSTTERTATFCSGCRRPITELSERRGKCDACRCRECCVHCLSQCYVCSKQLCGACRRGFPGPPAVTVCDSCRQRLMQRQMLQDRRSEFEQAVVRHRMYHQDQALRLNEYRLQLAVQLQAARLGLNNKTPLQRVLHGIGWTFGLYAKVICYAVKSLR